MRFTKIPNPPNSLLYLTQHIKLYLYFLSCPPSFLGLLLLNHCSSAHRIHVPCHWNQVCTGPIHLFGPESLLLRIESLSLGAKWPCRPLLRLPLFNPTKMTSMSITKKVNGLHHFKFITSNLIRLGWRQAVASMGFEWIRWCCLHLASMHPIYPHVHLEILISLILSTPPPPSLLVSSLDHSLSLSS